MSLVSFVIMMLLKGSIVISFPLCQTVHEGRIYQLKLFCDKDYPEKPPSVRFHSRINMTCVNHETGVVSVLLIYFLSALRSFSAYTCFGETTRSFVNLKRNYLCTKILRTAIESG